MKESEREKKKKEKGKSEFRLTGQCIHKSDLYWCLL